MALHLTSLSQAHILKLQTGPPLLNTPCVTTFLRCYSGDLAYTTPMPFTSLGYHTDLDLLVVQHMAG